MKIRSLLSFYDTEPEPYEDFIKSRIDTADSIKNHDVWMALYKFEFEKREESK